MAQKSTKCCQLVGLLKPRLRALLALLPLRVLVLGALLRAGVVARSMGLRAAAGSP
jgi:hypothetical protein